MESIRYPALIESGSGTKYQDQEFYTGGKYYRYMIGDEFFKFPDTLHCCVDANIGFRKHAHKVNLNSQTGSTGSTIRDITTGPLTDRMEVVTDPDDVGKKCWKLQVNKDDIDAQSLNAKRAEFNVSENRIKAGQVVTAGYKFRLNDYRTATDSFLIQQFKGLDSEVPFSSASPWFAINILSGVLVMDIRTSNVDNTGDIQEIVYSDANWLPNTWYSVVVETKTSTARGVNGYVKVWLNGIQVVDYVGEVGYFTPNNYVMCGFYQWGGDSWPWDLNFPTKTMYFKGIYVYDGALANDMLDFVATL